MSEILNRIDFAGRARFQFYDAFSGALNEFFLRFLMK